MILQFICRCHFLPTVLTTSCLQSGRSSLEKYLSLSFDLSQILANHSAWIADLSQILGNHSAWIADLSQILANHSAWIADLT